jgi:alpha-L-fucosidase
MKKSGLFSLFGLLFCQFCLGQKLLPAEKQWFTQAKYGTFIHWCLDGDSNETFANQFPEAYRKASLSSAKRFRSDGFDANTWAKEIKKAGSKYVVLTTKHHVGFALFDSPRNRFTATKCAPGGKDFVKPFCEAIRKEGLKVGLYFSLPDRSHPFYHSIKMKDKLQADSVLSDFSAWEKFTSDMLFEISWLCRNYGKIDLFWFDGDWERNAALWKSRQIVDTIKKYQPWAVINNRLRDKDLGDYSTPEMVIPKEAPGHFPAWELCTTLGYNWDGPDADKNLKSPTEILEILSHVFHLGGNVLLNISPDKSGKLPENQISVLEKTGDWIRMHQEAIFGTYPGLPSGLFDGKSTIKDGVLYLFLAGKQERELVLRGIEGEIESAQMLHSGEKLPTRWMRDYHERDQNAKPWKFIKIRAEQCRSDFSAVKVTFKGGKFSF